MNEENFGVVVERIKPRAVRLGLTEDLVKMNVELMLEGFGFKVSDVSEGVPFIYIKISTFFIPFLPIVVCWVRVQLWGMVQLNSGFMAAGVLWRGFSIGYMGTYFLVDKVLESIYFHLEKGIESRAANPQEPTWRRWWRRAIWGS